MGVGGSHIEKDNSGTYGAAYLYQARQYFPIAEYVRPTNTLVRPLCYIYITVVI